MPLHLLHHKSWHVYNTANVERVRRDQENARRKEEDEEMRMNQADQERRLQQLRGNAYGTDVAAAINPSDPVERPSNTIPGLKRQKKDKHVNLFEDVEKKTKVEGNEEREKELAVEKKKWEDMVTSKLVNATKDHSPWYSQLDKVSGVDKERSEIEKELKEKKQQKWKDDADPLKVMERFLEKKREVDEREERRREKMEKEMTERERRRGRGQTPEHDDRGPRHRSDGERRHRRYDRSKSPKREHQRRRHRHRHGYRSRSPTMDIHQLRAEREKREAAEREKIQKLMEREKVNDRYEPVGHGGYSAQFNPESVRR